MVPLVGIELTTYRLQGTSRNRGCCNSSSLLRSRLPLHFISTGVAIDLKLVPSVRIERTTYRLPYHFGFRRLIVRGLDYPLALASAL